MAPLRRIRAQPLDIEPQGIGIRTMESVLAREGDLVAFEFELCEADQLHDLAMESFWVRQQSKPGWDHQIATSIPSGPPADGFISRCAKAGVGIRQLHLVDQPLTPVVIVALTGNNYP